jgi:hypothetical protein
VHRPRAHSKRQAQVIVYGGALVIVAVIAIVVAAGGSGSSSVLSGAKIIGGGCDRTSLKVGQVTLPIAQIENTGHATWPSLAVQITGLDSFVVKKIAADNIDGVDQGAGTYTFAGDSVSPGQSASLHLYIVAKTAGNANLGLTPWGQKDANSLQGSPSDAPTRSCSYAITP